MGGTQVLEGCSIDRTVGPQHAGDGCAALLHNTKRARPASSRRAAGGMINLALIGLGEASHGVFEIVHVADLVEC